MRADLYEGDVRNGRANSPRTFVCLPNVPEPVSRRNYDLSACLLIPR
jgi:hypothetical protein